MKNKMFLIFQLIFVLVAVLTATVVIAEDSQAEKDSPASKGYVNEKIEELLETLESGGIINVAPSAPSDLSKYKYVPVHVGVGQKLIGDEGTEVILRVGRSFAVVTGAESLIDVTSGTELKDKAEISKNHIVIVPRNDGRGVRVVEDAWFLVKGGYTIGNVE